MIEAQGLTKQFDQFIAVDGVDLRVETGQVLILLGPNGAGKTTTVRMLTSILRPTRGWAKVAGFDVVSQPDQVRKSVGVLTEQHGLYGRMNSLEYLEFYGDLYGMPRNLSRARSQLLLEQFSLADVTKKRLGEYSKGMRQKLALVRALLHDPPVLLLDEPTSAMDPESARMVRDAIQTLRSNDRTIILCTHNLLEAEELADRIAIIRRGRIVLNDTLKGIKSSMLGVPEYEVHFTNSLKDWTPVLPAGVQLMGQGERWARLQVAEPEQSNPRLLRQMIEQNLEVVSFQQIPRSLEQAYLQALRLEQAKELG